MIPTPTQEPRDYTAYNRMMEGRTVVDFSNPDFCAKCGKRNGDHAARNKYACQFVRKGP